MERVETLVRTQKYIEKVKKISWKNLIFLLENEKVDKIPLVE